MASPWLQQVQHAPQKASPRADAYGQLLSMWPCKLGTWGELPMSHTQPQLAEQYCQHGMHAWRPVQAHHMVLGGSGPLLLPCCTAILKLLTTLPPDSCLWSTSLPSVPIRVSELAKDGSHSTCIQLVVVHPVGDWWLVVDKPAKKLCWDDGVAMQAACRYGGSRS